MQLSSRRHDRTGSFAQAIAAASGSVSRDRLPLFGNLSIPRPHDGGMEIEPGQCAATEDGSAAGIRTGDSLSGGSGQVLPTSQGRAFDGVARTIRHLVHWLASRTISDTKKSQKDRTPPVAKWKDPIESQPARGP